MLLLAFDTTAAACSVAVSQDGAARAEARVAMNEGQAEALIPLIEQVMAEAGIDYAEIDRIAVTTGPGSFTGVRVGLATARAIGLAACIPVVGVSSLEVLAAGVPEAERKGGIVLSAIDTKRGDIYAQMFDAATLAPTSEPRAMPPSDLAAWAGGLDIVVAGDAAGEATRALPRAFASTADALPNAMVLARLAANRLPQVLGPLPLYVLPPKITREPHGGKIRP